MDSYILTLDSQLISGVVIQLISTGILVSVLHSKLYGPVTEFLQKRADSIANNVKQAEGKLNEADKLKADYQAKLTEIEKERTEILENARSQAKSSETKIIEEAKKEAEAIKSRAKLDIEREQEKVKEEIKTQIVEVSSLIASKFIQEKINESEQSSLIDQVISDLGEVEWQK